MLHGLDVLYSFSPDGTPRSVKSCTRLAGTRVSNRSCMMGMPLACYSQEWLTNLGERQRLALHINKDFVNIPDTTEITNTYRARIKKVCDFSKGRYHVMTYSRYLEIKMIYRLRRSSLLNKFKVYIGKSALSKQIALPIFLSNFFRILWF